MRAYLHARAHTCGLVFHSGLDTSIAIHIHLSQVLLTYVKLADEFGFNWKNEREVNIK